MNEQNDKCEHCGVDTGQINVNKWKVYCNKYECKEAFKKAVMIRNVA